MTRIDGGGYDLKQCIKRLGGVLVGKPIPAMVQMVQEADRVIHITNKVTGDIGSQLRNVYESAVAEPIPEDMLAMLNSLGGGVGGYNGREKSG